VDKEGIMLRLVLRRLLDDLVDSKVNRKDLNITKSGEMRVTLVRNWKWVGG
jgi:hypothetical protein